jgi:hypothetical protein
MLLSHPDHLTHKITRMQKTLHTLGMALLLVFSAKGQVTQINADESLEMLTPLTETKTLFTSGRNGTLWVSEAKSLYFNRRAGHGAEREVHIQRHYPGARHRPVFNRWHI